MKIIITICLFFLLLQLKADPTPKFNIYQIIQTNEGQGVIISRFYFVPHYGRVFRSGFWEYKVALITRESKMRFKIKTFKEENL